MAHGRTSTDIMGQDLRVGDFVVYRRVAYEIGEISDTGETLWLITAEGEIPVECCFTRKI